MADYNNKIEYVLSGLGYIHGILHSKLNHESIEFIQYCIKRLNTAFPDQDFSMLYNGWTEPEYGNHFKEQYEDCMPNIYADSGGLQVVTRGKQITEELKLKVYENQGRNSSCAFIFDEMPISFTGTKSGRLDTTTRWYDMERFEGCALATGVNVAKQIESFLDMKSKAKPMFIVQGNCYDTCMEWTRLALSQIPKAHHKYITAAAMSFSSMGFGMLEDIKRAFYFTELPFDLSHIHLLGVGAVSRLMPQLLFCQTGVYKNMRISYDSTSHSGSIMTGRYFMNGADYRFPRSLDAVRWPTVYADMKKHFPTYDLTIEQFFDGIDMKMSSCAEKYDNYDVKVKSEAAAIFSQIWNFMDMVEEYKDDEKALYRLAKKKKCENIIRPLAEVKNYDDFKYWEHHFARFTSSKAISKTPKTGLVDFFS